MVSRQHLENKQIPGKRALRAFMNSLAGLRYLLRYEVAFRQEALAFTILAPLAWMMSEDIVTLTVLMAAIGFVFVVEALNTAIEAVCDAVSLDFHPHIKIAKDCGSSAVLMSIIIAVGVWLSVAYLMLQE